MSFENHLEEEIRLVILRSLNELPSYRGNSSTLHRRLTFFAIDVVRASKGGAHPGAERDRRGARVGGAIVGGIVREHGELRLGVEYDARARRHRQRDVVVALREDGAALNLERERVGARVAHADGRGKVLYARDRIVGDERVRELFVAKAAAQRGARARGKRIS